MQSLFLKWRDFHQHKPEYAFLVRLAVVYGVLEGIHQYFKSEEFGIKILNALTYLVAKHSGEFAQLFGLKFDLTARDYGELSFQTGYQMYLNDLPSVYVAYDCNGAGLFIAFVAFLFAFNFKWNRHLIWFAPLGLLLIHGINILRVLGLAYVHKYYPEHLDINHKYFFTIAVYALILILLFGWLKLFHNPQSSKVVHAE